MGDAFHFPQSVDEKDELIRFYRHKTGNGFFFYYPASGRPGSPLVKTAPQLSLTRKKSEGSGPIYQSVPITLIFDCDSLKSRQLASLNELLGNLPRLDGKPISTKVSRVVLAYGSLIRQPDAPGPDFWRRVFALNDSASETSLAGPPHKAVFGLLTLPALSGEGS